MWRSNYRGIAAITLVALVLYSFATGLHFFHNGVYLNSYPNMPGWLSRGEVFGALAFIYLVGITGCLLVWLGARLAGFLLIGLYAAIGFDGLAHYSLAEFSRHTAAMNFTILFEVATAAALLATVIFQGLAGIHDARR